MPKPINTGKFKNMTADEILDDIRRDLPDIREAVGLLMDSAVLVARAARARRCSDAEVWMKVARAIASISEVDVTTDNGLLLVIPGVDVTTEDGLVLTVTLAETAVRLTS